MVLTINGKKNRLKKIDFDKLAESFEISHIAYSCESEPPIVGKVSHMWISEKR